MRRIGMLSDLLKNDKAVKHWEAIFDEAYEADNPDYWDYQWRYAVWKNKGLSIWPNVSLISNVGFRNDGTHTKKHNSELSGSKAQEMKFPLTHPTNIAPDEKFDRLLNNYPVRTKKTGLRRLIKKSLRKITDLAK